LEASCSHTRSRGGQPAPSFELVRRHLRDTTPLQDPDKNVVETVGLFIAPAWQVADAGCT
jgi:hypothetical protein